MWLKSPNINVNIDIRGDVENSEIVGIRIEGHNKSSRSLNGNLFQSFFVDYLGLPSLAEIQSRLAVDKAIRQGRYFESNSVESLWYQLTDYLPRPPEFLFKEEVYQKTGTPPLSKEWVWDEDMRGFKNTDTPQLSEGVAVRLVNVQLTTFLNRTPGYRYRFRNLVDEDFLIETQVPDYQYGSAEERVALSEDNLTTLYGLGDIRFRAIDGKYLLSVVSYENNDVPLDQWFNRLTGDFNDWEIVQRLSNGNPPNNTNFGFPVVVSDSVYKTLESLLEEYGALFAQEITGILQSVPHHTPLTWPTGIPKLVLYIGDRSSIKGICKPFPIFASAWSVVTNSQGDRYQYAYWPFLVGTENYQKTILDATSIIKYYMAEAALEPIFEFDYKYNWFSDQTPFTPDNIVDLYKSIKIKDKMKNRKEGTT